MGDFENFQDKVKNSFQKVKEHNLALEAEIKQFKALLVEIRYELESLKKASQSEYSASQQEDFHESSTGNHGVANRQQQTTDNNRRQSKPTTDDSRPLHPQNITLSELKNSLDSAFQGLTSREFSVFMALYELDQERGGNISYYELSLRLNLAESTIRDFINALIRKGIPIQKERIFNKKVSLSIKNEFKQLGLYQKLLKLRASRQGQSTLFDV